MAAEAREAAHAAESETHEEAAVWPPAEHGAFSEGTPLSAIERLTIPEESFSHASGEMSHPVPRRGPLLTAAWAASFVALAGLGLAAYAERDVLMERWPASKRVYATLGLIPGIAKGGEDKAAADKPPR